MIREIAIAYLCVCTYRYVDDEGTMLAYAAWWAVAAGTAVNAVVWLITGKI